MYLSENSDVSVGTVGSELKLTLVVYVSFVTCAPGVHAIFFGGSVERGLAFRISVDVFVMQ